MSVIFSKDKKEEEEADAFIADDAREEHDDSQWHVGHIRDIDLEQASKYEQINFISQYVAIKSVSEAYETKFNEHNELLLEANQGVNKRVRQRVFYKKHSADFQSKYLSQVNRECVNGFGELEEEINTKFQEMVLKADDYSNFDFDTC